MKGIQAQAEGHKWREAVQCVCSLSLSSSSFLNVLPACELPIVAFFSSENNNKLSSLVCTDQIELISDLMPKNVQRSILRPQTCLARPSPSGNLRTKRRAAVLVVLQCVHLVCDQENGKEIAHLRPVQQQENTLGSDGGKLAWPPPTPPPTLSSPPMVPSFNAWEPEVWYKHVPGCM
jgi:hypothetical protein